MEKTNYMYAFTAKWFWSDWGILQLFWACINPSATCTLAFIPSALYPVCNVICGNRINLYMTLRVLGPTTASILARLLKREFMHLLMIHVCRCSSRLVKVEKVKFLYARLQMGRIMVWWCPSVRVSVRPSQFSALFSYMLWHIDLKFCGSLYFYARKIKFECHQFP